MTLSPSRSKALRSVGMRVSIGVLLTLPVSCVSLLCERTLLTESIQPSGRHRVVVHSLRCHSTARTALHVSVLLPGDRPGATGNAVSFGDTTGFDVPNRESILRVDASWQSDREILVSYDPRATLRIHSLNVRGIAVILRPRSDIADSTSGGTGRALTR